MDCLTDRILTTRKPHRCFGCGRVIPAGKRLQLVETVSGDGFSRSYWCPVCQEVWFEGDYREEIAMGWLIEDDAWEEIRARIEDAETEAL